MTCPKCNKEIPYDHNLCGYCGNPIREKCPECGEMEFVGSVVCERIVREINGKSYEYVNEKVSSKESIPIISFIVMVLLYGVLFLVHHHIKQSVLEALFFGPILVFVILVIILSEIRYTTREKKRQEFFRLHPEYAEIIKKAESADAKAMADKRRKK